MPGSASDATRSLGSLALLGTPKLALFCSRRCPGTLILRTYDLVGALRNAPISLVGGFHSPMEQECLRFVFRGSGRAIICPARGLEGMRPKPEWVEPMAQGRLLVLSPFGARERRVSSALAERRNAFVAELADAIFVAYAAPGGGTERLALAALAAGKPVFTFNADAVSNLVGQGAHPVSEAGDIIRALLPSGEYAPPGGVNGRDIGQL